MFPFEPLINMNAKKHQIDSTAYQKFFQFDRTNKRAFPFWRALIVLVPNIDKIKQIKLTIRLFNV